MLLYDTLTREKRRFVPINDMKVGLYTCGPTVYSYQHIGNMKAYITWDLLKRVLKHNGYSVKHVMNVTDVGHLIGDMDYGEDKVKTAAAREHKSVREVVEKYSGQFFSDLARLNVQKPDIIKRASDSIPEILNLIGVLEEKGYLYRLDDGMYFDTSRFKGYGALTGMGYDTLKESLKAGARVERPEGMKNVTDFAVWRLAKPGEKEMVWDTKYGRGFPGWHIECSAISMEYLGNHFDIHCGGIDHIQVHHTNEIAQSEAVTGERFVNYWMHNGFLKVNNGKMGKTFGNGYTVQDLAERGYSPLAYRYFVLTSHYRSELNFTFDALDGAENTLKKVYSLMDNLGEVRGEGEPDKEFGLQTSEARARFYDMLDDDLGTPEALSAFHELVGIANQKLSENSMTRRDAEAVVHALLEMDGMLAIGLSERRKVDLTPETEQLLKEREEFRERGDFKSADRIRERLRVEFGLELIDTKDGVRVRKTR